MSRYNTFRGKIVCPNCMSEVIIGFQSEAGRLEWHDFELGNNIWKAVAESVNSPIMPDTNFDLKDINFWTNGIGNCSKCGFDVFARIEIEKGIFTSVKLQTNPSKKDLYEFLGMWGVF